MRRKWKEIADERMNWEERDDNENKIIYKNRVLFVQK